METWYIAPGHEEWVHGFLESLVSLQRDSHPCCISSFVPRGTVLQLQERLIKFYTPSTLRLLGLKTGEDYFFEEHSTLDDLIIKVRTTFVLFLEAVETPELEHFLMLYRFQVLFSNETHGLTTMFKQWTLRLLQVFHDHSVLALFLLFCEFYPDMVTADFYPVCRPVRASQCEEQLEYIESQPELFYLSLKHGVQWQHFLTAVLRVEQ